MAKTGLAQLPKQERKIAQSEMSKRTRKLKADFAMTELLNTGFALSSSVAAAAIDHKFRKGTDNEARLGAPDPAKPNKFRPPVNAVLGATALTVGVAGALYKKKWAGPALATGIGFGCPATYQFTRNQLAK